MIKENKEVVNKYYPVPTQLQTLLITLILKTTTSKSNKITLTLIVSTNNYNKDTNTTYRNTTYSL
jgi:hypothetical protein